MGNSLQIKMWIIKDKYAWVSFPVTQMDIV